MVLNKGLACLKLLKHTPITPGGIFKQSVRNSGGPWVYRTGSIPHKRNLIVAECLGAFFWWWVIYHCISEPGHLIGEFPYPDPSTWTNEELGIPPDDAE